MVVSALQQKILKRNSQKYKPNLTLIVNPNYRPGKSGKIQNNISKPTIFKSKFFRKRRTGLITLFFLLSISATLLLFCFPIFSLNRELAEFSFSDTGGSIIDFLPNGLTPGLKQQAKPNAAALSNLKTSFYKVKNGDSLSRIAKKFELEVGTVISFNKISNARAIQNGTQLEIPNHNGLRYVVKKGDSLNDLSKRYNISLDKLLDWNNLESSIIRKGQVLFLPGAKLSRSEINDVLGRLFIYPTVGALSSGFGWRNSPFSGIREFHKGIDLRNAIGTKVVAAREGRITRIGYDAIYGNYIIITHNDGFHTLYGHLKTILVSKGAYVSQGQKIALMGTTGMSTGSHLHFSIFKNGNVIDPFIYLK